MKTHSSKNMAIYLDNKNRHILSDCEIFFDNFLLLKQSNYSNNLVYFFLKRKNSSIFFTKLRNRCLLSGYSRSVVFRLRLSRGLFSKKVLDGSLTGFLRSVR